MLDTDSAPLQSSLWPWFLRSNLFVAFLGVLCCYILSFRLWFILPLVLLSIYALKRQRSRWIFVPLLTLLCTIIYITPLRPILIASFDYSTGNAVFYRQFPLMGIVHSTNRYSIHPICRCRYASLGLGCIVPPPNSKRSIEIGYRRLYNKIVLFLSRQFGPMRGAYSGNLPTLRRAKRLLEKDGSKLRYTDIVKKQLSLSGRIWALKGNSISNITLQRKLCHKGEVSVKGYFLGGSGVAILSKCKLKNGGTRYKIIIQDMRMDQILVAHDWIMKGKVQHTWQMRM